VGNLVFYLLIGLGLGALYAMLGMSVVVAYRGSGVVNFAQGAMAMYTVFNYTQLRQSGQIYLPWYYLLPGHHFPVEITITRGPMPFIPSILVSLVMAILIGALVHFVVFRPLRNASALGKVVASVGLLLYFQAVAYLNFVQGGAETARQLPPVFPGGAWKNFLGLHHSFPKENLYAAIAAIVMAGIVWFAIQYTRLGLATRAAAENEKGAVLLGFSPDFLAGSSWIFASVIGAAGGFLVGPIAGQLTPIGYDSFIVPALGAALIGLLRSIPITLLGGLGLGALESFVGSYLSDQKWFPSWLAGRTGLASIIPLLAIALVLFLRGKSLPTRGTVGDNRLPPASRPTRVTWYVLAGTAAVVIYGSTLHASWILALTTTMITAILMLSYVVVTGYVGQISLAQLGLSGVAAFFMVKLMNNGKALNGNPFPIHGPGLPFILAVPLGMALAVVVGILVGLPAVRIRGVQLGIITLAAGLTMVDLYFKNPKLTGVSQGSAAAAPNPELFGINLAVTDKKGLSDHFAFTLFVLVVLIAVAVVVSNLRKSASGRRFLAIRANERAAAASGIDVTRTKLLAFAFAAAIAGLSGCLLAFQQQNISSDNFDPLAGLAFLAFAYLGGISSVNGAIVGGFIASGGVWSYFLTQHFNKFENYWVVLGAVGLILTAIANPMGIAPAVQGMLAQFVKAVRSWRGPEWVRALRRLGPPIVIGGVLGFLFWGRHKNSHYWATIDGIVLALMLRGIALQVWASINQRRHFAAGEGPAAPSGPLAAVASTNAADGQLV
jgi:branched-chain amino acid transport system permease protein